MSFEPIVRSRSTRTLSDAGCEYQFRSLPIHDFRATVERRRERAGPVKKKKEKEEEFVEQPLSPRAGI